MGSEMCIRARDEPPPPALPWHPVPPPPPPSVTAEIRLKTDDSTAWSNAATSGTLQGLIFNLTVLDSRHLMFQTTQNYSYGRNFTTDLVEEIILLLAHFPNLYKKCLHYEIPTPIFTPPQPPRHPPSHRSHPSIHFSRDLTQTRDPPYITPSSTQQQPSSSPSPKATHTF